MHSDTRAIIEILAARVVELESKVTTLEVVVNAVVNALNALTEGGADGGVGEDLGRGGHRGQ